MRSIACLLIVLSPAAGETSASGQTPSFLDPARDSASLHTPPLNHLREQFIWTKDDAAALDPALQSKVRGQNDKTAPHFFRARFHLQSLPAEATLYLAGPRSATVYLNGTKVMQLADQSKQGKGFNVSAEPVASALRPGENVIAVEEVRGHSSLHTGASPTINQVTYGEVLLVKIVPRGVAVDAPPVLISDASWHSTLQPSPNWSALDFDDSTWPTVQTLGIPGTKSDFLQWNADAGLYAWPGYTGIGAAMRTFTLPVTAVLGITGQTRLPNLAALTQPSGGSLTVLAPTTASDPAAITVDFGRELNGRIHLVSQSDTVLKVVTSYGESPEEALGHPYLGPRTLTIPPHGEAFGPKSGFRYVRLTFPPGESEWSRIDVEGITYPVKYAGSFESSDPQLNRIWETAAYTAHLCMQEGIWDAPKRDRGRWMGDLDVTGRTINSVFADRTLMEDTMEQVIGDSPVSRDVNTIAGYSALWITGQADLYRHLGDIDYLRKMHGRLLELLTVMDAELNSAGLFTNPGSHKVFVDWSTGFNADTPEARAATQFEFYLAYREAAYLLAELGDTASSTAYSLKADRLRAAAQASLLDPATQTFGNRWQTNAMAVVSGAATEPQRQAIWNAVLTHVDDGTSGDGTRAVVTPYYGFYVLSAIATLDHRPEALQWMRQYWGGMLDEGATSFYEAFDPNWPRQDFHAYLQADNKTGYNASLAHGWSSGPAAWLMQQILGIEPTARGFSQVTIRPDLAGLQWARGAEPTPRGLITIDAKPDSIRIALPPGTTAMVLLPFPPTGGTILQDGRPIATTPDSTGTRSVFTLRSAGEHLFSHTKAPTS